MAKDKHIIIFFHIQKTAGTTLSRVMEREYGKKRVFTYREMRKICGIPRLQELCRSGKVPKVIRGHIDYGIHRILPEGYSHTYVTLLRNPIDRFISQFAHYKRRVLLDKSNPKKVFGRHCSNFEQLTLYDIVKQVDFRLHIMYNHMVRRFCCLTWEAEVEDFHVEIALNRLKTMFFGVVERFDDFFNYIRYYFKWKTSDYHSKRVQHSREQLAGMITPKVETLIRKRNYYDMIFYSRAIEILGDMGAWNPTK